MPSQGRPRLGILAFHVIQYQVPLYQRLAARDRVDLDVLFVRETGARATFDPGFGREIAWDIDLLGGYRHAFLADLATRGGALRRLRALRDWVRAHEVVVIHGYSDPWMLAAVALCRRERIPYLLRGDSKPEAQGSHGLRRRLRDRVARTVVSRSAGALTIGELNTAFYTRFGQERCFWAPYSVDIVRFAEPHRLATQILDEAGLPRGLPVVLMVAKMIPLKRHLDVVAAVARQKRPVALLLVGEGPTREEVESAARAADLEFHVTGFINQSDLPAYYQAADVLVLASDIEQWGLVVNEGMASGLIPVVSDHVGAAPDLVDGIGYVFPVGDIDALATCLDLAVDAAGDPYRINSVHDRASSFTLDLTAEGFETAAHATCHLGTAPRGQASA